MVGSNAGPSTSSPGGGGVSLSSSSSSSSLPQHMDDVLSLIHSLSLSSSATGASGSANAAPPSAGVVTRSSTAANNPDASLFKLSATLDRLCTSRKGKGEEILLELAQGSGTAQSAGGVEALTLLQPQSHSLGLLWILSARTAAAISADQANLLSPFLGAFLTRADPRQWSLAPHRIIKLAQGIASLSLLLNDPTWALPLLQVLFERVTGRNTAGYASPSNLALPAGPRTFTPLHHILVYQCLLSRHYQAAFDLVLAEPIEELANPSTFQYTYSDLLQHYYYAGLVFAKVERWAEACGAFETAISCPAQALSAIHVDAYKKLILCQLVKDGRTSPLPAYVSAPISRLRRANPADLNVYLQLAQLYARKPRLRIPVSSAAHGQRLEEDESVGKLFALEEGSRAVFQRDANLGLVRLALSLHRQRRIQSLSSMFRTLSVADAVSFLGLEREGQSAQEAQMELERDLDEMIAKGWIQARLSPSPAGGGPKLLTFLSSSVPSAAPGSTSAALSGGQDERPFESTSDVQLLSSLLAKVARSNERVKEREREISRSEGFLRKQQATRDGRMLGGAFAGGMDVDVEEDVFG